ncbi:MAG: EAL domain-containing protein [Gammaproteobacteria bacterium]|nr:EAL domain-containing protein [Gammaproteobacteria bacterium]
MKADQSIRLLVANQDESESMRLISMLESAGIKLRPQFVASSSVFDKLVSEQTWDLAIIDELNEDTPYKQAIQSLRKDKLDIPLILLCDADDYHGSVVKGIKAGAVDVVPFDHDQHLIAVVKREFNNKLNRASATTANLKRHSAESNARALLDDSRTPVAYLQDGMFLFFNDALRLTLGFDTEDDLLVTPIADIATDANVKKRLSKLATGEKAAEQETISTKLTREDGTTFDATLLVRSTEFDGESVNEIFIPTHRLMPGENNAHETPYKAPTLLDRRRIVEIAQRCILESQEGRRRQLILLQSPDFEATTSGFGIAEKDSLLESLSEYLNDEFAELGHWGSFNDGRFVLICEHNKEELAKQAIDKAIDHLDKQVWDAGSLTARLSLRAGICRIIPAHETVDTLIDAAEQAYQNACAQNAPSAIYEFDDEEKPALTTEEIVEKVKQALQEQRFKLLFQPIINLHGNTQELYEVLLRLIDEDGNDVSPSEWRREVAQSGLAAHIDRWVLREAAKKLTVQSAQGHDTKLLINLSEAAIRDEGLPAFLGSLFKAANLPKESIILQMSERDVNKHVKAAAKLTESLAGLQCHAALTHFGSSLKPFETLKHLIIDWVKVDGSYTQELQSDNGDTATLTNLLEQLHEGGWQTIVPMVENASIINKLWQSGAQHIQGYYVQAPAEEMSHNFELF